MKTVMYFLSLLIVTVGFCNVFTDFTAGTIVMVFGSLIFLFTASIKQWK